jgi:hypothetical protein
MKLEDVKIKGWGMVSHMSMEKEHLSKYQGTFECEGYLSEKTVVRESSVKKDKYGEFSDKSKEKNMWYLPGEPLTFKTVQELVLHYAFSLIDA